MANCDEEKKICLFARQNLELCALSDQTLDQMSNCPYFQCLVLSLVKVSFASRSKTRRSPAPNQKLEPTASAQSCRTYSPKIETVSQDRSENSLAFTWQV